MMKMLIQSLPMAWYDDEKGSTPLVAKRAGESISLVRLDPDWHTVEEEE